MEVKVSQLLFDLDVPLAAWDRLLHPFGLGEGLLLGADLNGVGVAVDEVGEGRGLVRQPRSERLEGPGGLSCCGGDGSDRGGSGGKESRRRSNESRDDECGTGLHISLSLSLSRFTILTAKKKKLKKEMDGETTASPPSLVCVFLLIRLGPLSYTLV